MNMLREESIIFNDLANLCASQGYAHVIAYFCYRDNTTWISEQFGTENIQEQHRQGSLIRTEISTLVGLLVKNELNLIPPSQDNIDRMIDQTEALLEELHYSLSQPMRSHLNNIAPDQSNTVSLGDILREPIFYGGESAYDFQYLDFSLEKYLADNNWLKTNKGFSIHDVKEVISHIIKIQQLKIQNHLENLRKISPENWTMLPAFIFELNDLVKQLDIEPQVINNILLAFCLPDQNRNNIFVAVSDFNHTNACPLISLGDNKYLLFQHYSLLESLYESLTWSSKTIQPS